jgi:hypothetical protein
MSDEQNAVPSTWARVTQSIRMALWLLLSPTFSLSLLAIAIAEALLAPFLGMKWALCGLATATAAVGLILAMGVSRIEMLGNWAQKLYDGVVSLHDEEMAKLSKSQQRAAPQEPPLPSWNM